MIMSAMDRGVSHLHCSSWSELESSDSMIGIFLPPKRSLAGVAAGRRLAALLPLPLLDDMMIASSKPKG